MYLCARRDQQQRREADADPISSAAPRGVVLDFGVSHSMPLKNCSPAFLCVCAFNSSQTNVGSEGIKNPKQTSMDLAFFLLRACAVHCEDPARAESSVDSSEHRLLVLSGCVNVHANYRWLVSLLDEV